MRRPGGSRALAGSAASLLAACLPALLAPAAGAVQDVFSGYGELIRAGTPSPLVATTLPAGMGSLEKVEIESAPEARGRYSLFYANVIPASHPGALPRTAATLAVRAFGSRSLAAEARALRRNYRERSTRVRGRPGLLLRAKHTTTVALVWSEGGRIYELGTGTPKAVSVADLQATAEGLGHLLGALVGNSAPFGGPGASAEALVTDRAVILSLSWAAACSQRGSTLPPLEGGGAGAVLSLPLSGGAFSFGPAPVSAPRPLLEGEGTTWTASVSGSASPSAGTITVQAASEGSRLVCSVGPVTATLAVKSHP